MTVAVGNDKRLQDELKRSGNIPTHIAIIMDGNGRWAKKRGLPRIAGHNEGVESVRDTVEACGQLGVKYLTLYAFSTENWKRPKDEVSMLMRLLMRALRDETDKLYQNNVRVRVIGDIQSLPQEVQSELADAIEKTKLNTGLNLFLALSYSGRWDVTTAIRKIADDVMRGTLSPESIDEPIVSAYLSTKDVPDPDLLIRTGGEVRISNFLLWQLAYSEIYISSLFWPEFRRTEIYAAIADYQHRERRFGMVSEQVQSSGHKPSTVTQFLKNVSRL
ncbi:MAG: isoprenyl transferase [Ignavibacteriae bacterium]|nr:isoprenyl transferase [Ignavibacteria bacterium]MBI3365421.1 isoprenyl transferase [Ignavibacteriota bacterium]